jgi:hypothetical protein
MILQLVAVAVLIGMVALCVYLFTAAFEPRDWEATATTFCTRCGRP